MRSMIIGLSALAITALPTLALADGDGVVTGAAGGAVAGAVVGGPGWRGGRQASPAASLAAQPPNRDL